MLPVSKADAHGVLHVGPWPAMAFPVIFLSQGVSSELYSGPGVLLPPPSLEGAVPLYNPSQVPQVRKPSWGGVRGSRLRIKETWDYNSSLLLIIGASILSSCFSNVLTSVLVNGAGSSYLIDGFLKSLPPDSAQ